MENLITADWLANHINDEDLLLLDATVPMVGTKAEPSTIQVIGARFFDIEYFSDQESPLPHMLPTPTDFEVKTRGLGLDKNHKIVIYDDHGIYSAPRAWWMFKAMGHDEVAVLDGGLPAWKHKGLPTEEKKVHQNEQGNFKSTYQRHRVKSMSDIEQNLSVQEFLVVDARSEGRFTGMDPEPRKGLSSGHMNGAVNIPFPEVLKEGKMKPKNELEQIFESRGIGNQQLVFSCGSGLTACIIDLAATLTLENATAVYDGSWTEWATNHKPIVKERT